MESEIRGEVCHGLSSIILIKEKDIDHGTAHCIIYKMSTYIGFC